MKQYSKSRVLEVIIELNGRFFIRKYHLDVSNIESLSEEIVEDLDVDDLLNSARSNADSISF